MRPHLAAPAALLLALAAAPGSATPPPPPPAAIDLPALIECRQRVADFIMGLFTDPQEDDRIYLSFSSGHPVALDKEPGKERSLKAVRAAYERGMISQEINGNFKEFTRMVRERHPGLFNDLQSDLLDFYDPREIGRRQKAHAENQEEDPYEPEARPPVPAGYLMSEGGGLQRAEKVGRNDPCPCGSGKKYKKCCGQS